MNYATLGDPAAPALLLIPGQTESWWGYEAAMPLLAKHSQVFAVDLRGQALLTGAGVAVRYQSFPDVGHSMQGEKPELYVETLLDWVEGLDG